MPLTVWSRVAIEVSDWGGVSTLQSQAIRRPRWPRPTWTCPSCCPSTIRVATPWRRSARG